MNQCSGSKIAEYLIKPTLSQSTKDAHLNETENRMKSIGCATDKVKFTSSTSMGTEQIILF